MDRPDNYALQARQAQQRFLSYDQQTLIRKLDMKADGEYLYIPMLSERYRISRTDGSMERETLSGWVEANSHAEVMTLLDLVCDSREDRHPSGRWQNMSNFGALFHRSLLEDREDPFARSIQDNPEGFRRACEAMGGTPGPRGDISYAMEVFDGLQILVQFWEEDEEFPPSVTWMWDANALMYLKYETMWFALGMLQKEILSRM